MWRVRIRAPGSRPSWSMAATAKTGQSNSIATSLSCSVIRVMRSSSSSSVSGVATFWR